MSNQPSPVSVQEFNKRVEEAAKAMRLKPTEVLYHLSEVGVEADEDAIPTLESTDFKFEDAQSQFVGVGLWLREIDTYFYDKLKNAGCSVVDGETPERIVVNQAKIVGFRRGFRILKGNAVGSEEQTRKDPIQVLVENNRPVEQWGDQELVEKYGPDCESRIAEELARRSKDVPFVVFKDGNAVNVEATLFLLRQARRNKPVGRLWSGAETGGKTSHVHPVGEFPLEYVEECPLHGDIILVGGHCEKCKASWDGIDNDDRVIIRVAKMADQSLGKGAIEAAKVIGEAKAKGAKALLEIGDIGLTYQDLEADNRLPVLRRRMSRAKNGDPFNVTHKRF